MTRKAATTQKPAAMNNNWLGNTVTQCTLKVIEDYTDQGQIKSRWKTVGNCIDTPNQIKTELKKKQYKGLSIWKFDGLGSKEYIGEVR